MHRAFLVSLIALLPMAAMAQNARVNATLPNGTPIHRAAASSAQGFGYYAVPVYERNAQGQPVCVENCPRGVPVPNTYAPGDPPRGDAGQPR